MTIHRVINFNAGPAGLPLPALERAQAELLDYAGTGMSIMEHSHRGKTYEAVHHEAIALLRELLAVPANYQVLLLQGGARQAFATVPMNLLPAGRSADYVITGGWARDAFDEAKYVGTVRAAGPDFRGRFTRVPLQSECAFDPSAAYAHITSNNTLVGTQYHEFPTTGDVPLVADMSSDFLWRPFDVSRFGLVYAGAQKNLGPSGVTIFLVRDDLLAAGRTDIPKIFRFAEHAKHDSMFNTPPTFAIYLMRNVLSWVRDLGGLTVIEARNRAKAKTLYGTLDALSSFYKCPVETGSRSTMNVVFRLPDEALEAKLVAEAESNGMVGIKGHRSVGGIRVSMYNAVTPEQVETFAGFLRDFAARHG